MWEPKRLKQLLCDYLIQKRMTDMIGPVLWYERPAFVFIFSFFQIFIEHFLKTYILVTILQTVNEAPFAMF